MVDDNANNPQAQDGPPQPNPALESLDVLVGAWAVSGPEVRGRVAFEWMEGGFFLMQHVYLDHGGQRHKGTEYIGYDESNKLLKSYFFGNTGSAPFPGPALEYVWEVDDDTLTIWGGHKGSPAAFRASSATTATLLPVPGSGRAADTKRP